jgi:RNA polymerase sigma factor (sigma-70 family)
MVAQQGASLHISIDHSSLQRCRAGRQDQTSEGDLVLAIRALQRKGDIGGMHRLCVTLLERCSTEFQRRTHGLSHRPDLREEAIASMREHVLREALDEDKVFMTQNFPHYLRCVCAEEFKSVLRQEGLHSPCDHEGRPAHRPDRVPRNLLESWQDASSGGTEMPWMDIPDEVDQYEQLHAREECRRILAFLPDHEDRLIVVLRALEGLRFNKIARALRCSERTVRNRYYRATSMLRDWLNNGEATEQPRVLRQSLLKRSGRKADEERILRAERTRLEQALATLPPQERQVVVLRVLERRQWSYITRACSCSESSLRTSYAIALNKLRAMLTQEAGT